MDKLSLNSAGGRKRNRARGRWRESERKGNKYKPPEYKNAKMFTKNSLICENYVSVVTFSLNIIFLINLKHLFHQVNVVHLYTQKYHLGLYICLDRKEMVSSCSAPLQYFLYTLSVLSKPVNVYFYYNHFYQRPLPIFIVPLTQNLAKKKCKSW